VSSRLRRVALESELDGDLDGDRAGVGEEDALQSGRREGEQSLAERDGGLVGEAAEHDVGQTLELRAHRGFDMRMAIAVDDRPPGRHPVDQLAAVGEAQSYALGRFHGEERIRLGRRVGVPHGAAIPLGEREGLGGSTVLDHGESAASCAVAGQRRLASRPRRMISMIPSAVSFGDASIIGMTWGREK
jgi:hypothetical protein